MKSSSLLPFLGLSLLLLFTLPATGQVIISEFMADNKHTLADEDNQFPDWIELYNSSATTVNLAGWALTDDPTHRTKWTIPGTNLTAKGFLVIFASGKNRGVPGAPLHTAQGASHTAEVTDPILQGATSRFIAWCLRASLNLRPMGSYS